MSESSSERESDNEFERESHLRPPGFLAEFSDFLIHNKKWWLVPIMIVLLVLSLFVALTGSAIGPFIYVFI